MSDLFLVSISELTFHNVFKKLTFFFQSKNSHIKPTNWSNTGIQKSNFVIIANKVENSHSEK